MSKINTKSFPHISFGFRFEGILYQLRGKEYRINSTWIGGNRVYIDDLTKMDLDLNDRTKIFKEIVQFLIQSDGEKPIICYNSDFADAELWNKLAGELNSQISLEVGNVKTANINFYKVMSEYLKSGLIEVNIKGLKLKTIEDLDKNWNKIKYTKVWEENEKISLWDKLKAKFY